MRDGNRINVVHMEGLNVVLCVCTHTEPGLYHCHSGIDESGMDTYTPGYRVRMEQRLVSPQVVASRSLMAQGSGASSPMKPASRSNSLPSGVLV